MLKILDRVPKIPVATGKKVAGLKGAISLKDVVFAYPSRKDNLIL